MENKNINKLNINKLNIDICIEHCTKCNDMNCFEYPPDINCETLKCNYFYTSCIKLCEITKNNMISK